MRACHFGPLPSLPWPLGHVRLISFLGLVCAALLFFSTCKSSNSGPSGPVSKMSVTKICHITFLSGYICSDALRMFWRVVTDINHVLTPSHVTEINYVDRGVAARTPLQYNNGSLGNTGLIISVILARTTPSHGHIVDNEKPVRLCLLKRYKMVNESHLLP